LFGLARHTLQPRREDVEQRRDARQKEHRRQRELDDVRRGVEVVAFHV